ncbi:MAG: MFS transporter [Sphingobacteriales bacterium]|nr:MAG: MFS transporter [Sphingobacteriales bacterium]
MQLLSKLRLPLNLNGDEKKRTMLLFWHSFILGIATSFFFVASNSFFIKNVPLSNIPLAYIAAGLCGLFMVSAYKSYQSKHGVYSSYILSLILFAIISAALYFLHHNEVLESKYSVLLGYSAFVLIYPFSVLFVIGFSSIGLSIFNLAQSKRLTGLVGTGEVIASILGYLIVPIITKFVGNNEILFGLSAFILLASVLPLSKLKGLAGDAVNKPKATVKLNLRVLSQDGFYKLIASFTFFSVVAMYLSDYTYLLATRQLAAVTEIETAVIISVLFTLIKAGELTFSFLSGNIITSRGMHFALVLLPVVLSVIIISAFLSEFIFSEYAFFLIVFFLLNKWNERVIRKGITTPALKVLYQVTRPSERAQIQTLLEGLINQLATIVVGVLLYLLTSFIAKENPLHFFKAAIYVSMVLLAGWLFITNKLFHAYKVRVHDFLHSLKRADDTMPSGPQAIAINDKLVYAQMQKVNTLLSNNNKQSILDLLTNYHPALKGSRSDKISLPRLSKLYFQEDYFFSRWLLIKYLGFLPVNDRERLVLEWYDISNLELRREMVKYLHEDGYQVTVDMQRYFQARIEDVVKEVAWAEAAIHDCAVEGVKAFGHLFLEYRDAQQSHLLQLMKLIYDAAAIDTIEQIVTQKDDDVERNLFVVELLENLLPAEQRLLIVPAFEQVSYGRKRAKWGEVFYLYEMSAKERLKEYLLKDYKLVLPWKKHAALEIYNELFDDKTLLKAFAANRVPYLSDNAKRILKGEGIDAYSTKKNMMHELGVIDKFLLTDGFILEGTELLSSGKKTEVRHAFKENDFWMKHSTDGGTAYMDVIAMAICNS